MNPSEGKMCQEIVRYVRDVASPRKIVLFGSRARGDGDEDSDYDLLVVKDKVKSHQDESHQIRVALMALPIFADVLLRSSEEDKQKQQLQIGLQKSLMEEGVVLYEHGIS
jgi:predicted nucleotidyltransferase